MSPRRTLRVGQLSHLARLGEAVRRAKDGERELTILLALTAVRVYREGGTGFAELALALGIELVVLRDWLDRYAPIQPASTHMLPGPTRSVRSDRPGAGVLACSGDPRPGGNDFGREVAGIRDRVEPRFALVERTMIEIAELPECLDRFRPRVLHIAAHSTSGSVYLTACGEPVPIQHAQLTHALLSSPHQPSILVLNFCRSIEVVGELQHAIPAIVCWPDRVDDGQCRELSDILFRSLGGGRSIGQGMDAARITLPRYGGLQPAVLLGSRAMNLI